MIEKVPSTSIFHNGKHLDVVRAELRRWLRERVADPSDARFFRKFVDRRLQGCASTPDRTKAKATLKPKSPTGSNCSKKSSDSGSSKNGGVSD
jgi:hypothetical protein